MNIAVILTGHMRCWDLVYPNFKQRILDRYCPDIFIHTWLDQGYWTPQEIKTETGVEEDTPLIDVNLISEQLNPVEFVVENWLDYNGIFEEYAKKFTNFAHKPKNILSMFYKLNAGVSLLERHISMTGKRYDLVIRMRPDMILHQDLPEAQQFNPELLYTLAHRNHMGQGTGDQFHIGSVANIIAFSKISCFISQLYDKVGILCPHLISVEYLNRSFKWQEFYIQKTLQHTPNGEYQLSDKYK